MGKIVHFFSEKIDKTPFFCYNIGGETDMVTSFDVEHLNVFLRNFYTAVGIRISVFDSEFNLITEYPKDAPTYCQMIRRSKAGAQGCRACDVAAFKQAKTQRGLHIYTCHAGLTEAVAPIKLNDGVLGYVILAHMLPKETLTNATENALQKATIYGLEENEARKALAEIPSFRHEKINAASALMDAIATYLHISNWIQWRNENLAERISKYIELHLHEKLDCDALCRTFFLSRTKLHQLATDCYGLSISRYVLFKRISKAKELLKKGLSVERIAEETGFANGNYFCKVFKKEIGCTPSAYKKKYTEI